MKHSLLPAMCIALTTATAAPSLAPRTLARMAAGQETRVVAFGDSITGIYYHSGSRRAWPEMLQLALRRCYPEAKITVHNAGISGHTTGQGLQRIQHDVLDHNPHLVVVKFGMNDLAYGEVDEATDAKRKAHFAANLKKIVDQCRAIGAEVILCTPNSVYPESAPRRPPSRLGEFERVILDQAQALGVPVVDVQERWERIRHDEPTRWRVMMSETIHPSMAGHKCIAQWVASGICGQEISLADEPPPPLTAARFVARLRANKPTTAVVCAPLAAALRKVVLKSYPEADITLVPWPVEDANLPAVEAWSKGIRKRTPDLVVLSLPQTALAVREEEPYVRQASWVVNWSLPFGPHAWTTVGIATSSWTDDLLPAQKRGEVLLAKIVAGHDLVWLSGASPEELLRQWLADQIKALPPRAED